MNKSKCTCKYVPYAIVLLFQSLITNKNKSVSPQSNKKAVKLIRCKVYTVPSSDGTKLDDGTIPKNDFGYQLHGIRLVLNTPRWIFFFNPES